MATMRLVPSTIYLPNTQYVTTANVSNMYTNCDSTTYGTITHGRASTNNTYYAYIRGFNFDDLPSTATVTSFTVKIKASATGHTTSTSTSYQMSLYNGTTAIGSTYASGRLSTTVNTFTFANGSLTWDTVKGYGSNFGVRIPLRRASSNTADVVSVYGVEIEVTYTGGTQYNVTVQNSTSANVEVSDESPYEGDDVVVSINTLSGITVKDNGTDVTSQFTQATGGTESAVPGSHFTTGFSASGANFYQSSSTTSTSWLEYAIGHSAESPYSTSNTSNTYVKPEGQTGWINYEFDFSDIPPNATITSVTVKVYGARENATVDSTHVARFQCYSGSTAKGAIQNFTSTSNSSVTVSNVGTWTPEELYDAQLRFEVGYYGGRMLGITWTVVYEVNGYIYTITSIASDHTIVVTSSGGVVRTFWDKSTGTWTALSVTKVWKKNSSGVWVEQADWTAVFDANTNYVKG